LPPEIDPLSSKGLEDLGITKTDFRICYFGNTEITAHMLTLPDIGFGKIPIGDIQERIIKQNLWSKHMDNRVTWPTSNRVKLVVNTTTNRPFGPLLFRRSQESFGTGVVGVPVQIETKLGHGPSDSVVIFLPFLVDSFAWRWKNPLEANGVWENKMGAKFDHMLETVTRPPGYRPLNVPRPYFMASLVSHCEGNPSIPVREAFTYAVHKATSKPVHNLGDCPESDDGALLAGLTLGERASMKKQFHAMSALDVFSNYKFAVVFENSFLRGYFTEKLINAYVAGAIPVYYSESFEDLSQIVNPKAFIYCHVCRYLLPQMKKKLLTVFTPTKKDACGKDRAALPRQILRRIVQKSKSCKGVPGVLARNPSRIC